jgi:hypothetical protein
MKYRAALAVTALLLVACDQPTPTEPRPVLEPSFTTLSNEKIPLTGLVLFNPCLPAEGVLIENGFLHILVTGEVGFTSEDVTIHVNAQGIKGVGTVTGQRYSVPDNEKTSLTITDVPFTISEETDVRFRLIRAGEFDNHWLRLTFTFTFPPGTTKFTRMEIECRG